jgi:hypothetical protein
MKSLHGISPIIDGRHSFGCGAIGTGGDGGPNIGDTNGQQDRCAKKLCHFDGCAAVVVGEVGGLALMAAEGCGVAAIRAMARNKARWQYLDGAIDLFVSVCVPAANGLTNIYMGVIQDTEMCSVRVEFLSGRIIRAFGCTSLGTLFHI